VRVDAAKSIRRCAAGTAKTLRCAQHKINGCMICDNDAYGLLLQSAMTDDMKLPLVG